MVSNTSQLRTVWTNPQRADVPKDGVSRYKIKGIP